MALVPGWSMIQKLNAKRTWQNVMDEIPKLKYGNTRTRSETAVNSKAFDPIRQRVVLEIRAEHFLRALETGDASTSSYLRHSSFVHVGEIAAHPPRMLAPSILGPRQFKPSTVDHCSPHH
jgi:hypothetical protein